MINDLRMEIRYVTKFGLEKVIARKGCFGVGTMAGDGA
jgi:hypothetical protein